MRTDGPAAILSRARGGSVLFDEVTDLNPDAQGRIVRMLDTLGPDAPRIMATSQKDLMGRMEAGAQRWKRLAYVAITRASERLHWVVRNRLAKPSGALEIADLTPEAVPLELTEGAPEP